MMKTELERIEREAHKKLDETIRNCKNCCPVSKGEKYCNNCKKAVTDFMDKYGAGVLTKDETTEKIELLEKEFEREQIGREQAQQEVRELKQECHQWKETCEILVDPEIRKSISISLKQFAEGKGIKLKDL